MNTVADASATIGLISASIVIKCDYAQCKGGTYLSGALIEQNEKCEIIHRVIKHVESKGAGISVGYKSDPIMFEARKYIVERIAGGWVIKRLGFPGTFTIPNYVYSQWMKKKKERMDRTW